MTLWLDIASVIAVVCGYLQSRYMAEGRIHYVFPLLSGLCVAFIDTYAAVTHPEQRSFLLFSLVAVCQVWYAVKGISKYGAVAYTDERWR